MENSPSRVLIIDTAWLGDVIFSTALIGAARVVWPSAEIHFLTAPRARDIVMNHPYLSRVWLLDKHGVERSIFALQRMAAKLNAERFDVVLCAHPSTRSRLLCAMLKAPVRVGHEGFGQTWAFTHAVHNSLSIEPDHVARRLNLLHTLTPLANTPPLLVGLAPEERDAALSFLTSKAINDAPLLGLIPGSARLTKQWSPEHFAEFGRNWCMRTGGRALVFLGPSEAALAQTFSAHAPQIHVAMVNLRHCAALLNHCHTVVGNDTGVSFLAIAAGCPQVNVLYGSTQVNYNFQHPHRALAAGVPCCLSRTGHGEARCKWTGGAPWCMSQISVEHVIEKILPDH